MKDLISEATATMEVDAGRVEATESLAKMAGMTKVAENIQSQKSAFLAEAKLSAAGYTKKVLRKQYLDWKSKTHGRVLDKYEDDGWTVTNKIVVVENSLEHFDGTPPRKAIGAIAKAKRSGLFKQFMVVSLAEEESRSEIRKKVPDPVVFGLIDEAPHLYFITEWDDDVSLEDIASA